LQLLVRKLQILVCEAFLSHDAPGTTHQRIRFILKHTACHCSAFHSGR